MCQDRLPTLNYGDVPMTQDQDLTAVRCSAWCTDESVHFDEDHPDFGHCRTAAARVPHVLQPPIDMDDWSAAPDFTELGVGVELATQVSYVWDRHSDGREVLLTPAEARSKATAYLRLADLAEGSGQG